MYTCVMVVNVHTGTLSACVRFDFRGAFENAQYIYICIYTTALYRGLYQKSRAGYMGNECHTGPVMKWNWPWTSTNMIWTHSVYILYSSQGAWKMAVVCDDAVSLNLKYKGKHLYAT